MKTIYRLEISNIPYSVDFNHLQTINRVLEYIYKEYEVMNINGKLLRGLLDNIIIMHEGVTSAFYINPNSYIDFIMNEDDYDKFMNDFSDDLKEIQINKIYETKVPLLYFEPDGVKNLFIPKEVISQNEYQIQQYRIFCKCKLAPGIERMLTGYIIQELDIQECNIFSNTLNNKTLAGLSNKIAINRYEYYKSMAKLNLITFETTADKISSTKYDHLSDQILH